MSTLAEIEAAAGTLPPQDQWSLLAWLQGRLTSAPKAPGESAREHQAWLRRLERLRGAVGTGRTATPTEDILDDLRSERGG